MASSNNSVLKFVPFSSCIDPGFWHKLCQVKLHEYGLRDDIINIKGYYCNHLSENLPSYLNIDYNAWDIPGQVGSKEYKMKGSLKITNTIEDFKNLDLNSLLQLEGLKIWEDISSGRAFKDPSLLGRFLLVTFANLKKFTFHYWCSFPALCPSEKFTMDTSEVISVKKYFGADQITELLMNYDKFQGSNPSECAFIVKEDMTVHALACLQYNIQAQITIGLADPSNLTSNPGWPLRNLLILLSTHCYSKLHGRVRVLCLRDRMMDGVRSVDNSIIINVHLVDMSGHAECPKVIGWEKNSKDQSAPSFLDLSIFMNPQKLCESAVDLNLKLMKWRLAPELDLDTISSTRCLLLGAGTLGCNVARCLLGWGIRNITFVDNSRISYSNPVRQSLFKFNDCLEGGRPKAGAAAEALKEIYPLVNAVGINLSIPMPGHSISSKLNDSISEDINRLVDLISNHDVIFLLMDTRESRWLPTLLGRSLAKIVFSVALGFDTYLVIRHGVGFSEIPNSDCSLKIIPGSQLGCYFCNDITSPGDSTQDRTLDQQCTVTRPGVSFMAASSAVELLVSLLNHPLKGQASAKIGAGSDGIYNSNDESMLGILPHQIRGFISNFNNIMPTCRSFNMCTACSPTVLDAYRRDGLKFLFESINNPSSLEDITGLSKLHRDTKDIEILELSDCEFDEN